MYSHCLVLSRLFQFCRRMPARFLEKSIPWMRLILFRMIRGLIYGEITGSVCMFQAQGGLFMFLFDGGDSILILKIKEYSFSIRTTER